MAVHNELVRRRAEVAYVKTRQGLVVDFLSRTMDGNEELIQVCAVVDDPITLSREVRALESAAKEHPARRQLVLTSASRLPFPATPKTIEVMPAWQWMLEDNTQRS